METYSLANVLVTSSISRAAIVTFLVAFLGKGLIPPENKEENHFNGRVKA
jgi:hypothetical protein